MKEDLLDYYCNAFIEKLAGSNTSIRNFTIKFDRLFNLDTGTGVYIFKRLIALKRIMVDMDKKIDLNDSTQSIKIVQQSLLKRVGVL
ncbi:TnsA endonuclease C-terminal domain-containing protein [Thermoanaerobacterium thermosaccharolyticum]|uniref:TnsA endonuclease C-terminal domain-containing protein n=1 Tax=Thermoanaerobacterium thermosaccharolyticum TaxID=1517 RepID=UPI0001B11364|nr:TnsA endonuclease C-terminal domain-containing protein [Thermoanaerobacterium thermosaccharolyticum]